MKIDSLKTFLALVTRVNAYTVKYEQMQKCRKTLQLTVVIWFVHKMNCMCSLYPFIINRCCLYFCQRMLLFVLSLCLSFSLSIYLSLSHSLTCFLSACCIIFACICFSCTSATACVKLGLIGGRFQLTHSASTIFVVP
jgi:hypothetical protein